MVGITHIALGALLAPNALAINPQVVGASIRPGQVSVFGTTPGGTAWQTFYNGSRWTPSKGAYPFWVTNVSTLTAYGQPGHYDVFGVRGAPPPGVGEAFNVHYDGQNTTIYDLGPAIGRLSQAVQADARSGQSLRRLVARGADRTLVTRWAEGNDSAWFPSRWWTLAADTYDTAPRAGSVRPGRTDVFAIANGTVRWLYASASDALGGGDVALDTVPGGLCAFAPATLNPPGVALFGVGCADSTLYYKGWNGTTFLAGWKDLGRVWGLPPDAVVAPGVGQILLTLRNADTARYVYKYYDRGAWSEFLELGNQDVEFASAPQTVTDLSGTIWFFGIGVDNNLYYYRWADKKLPIEAFTWTNQGSILVD